MILLADSGSTKTDWCLVDQKNSVTKVRTAGINPFFQSSEEIANELATHLVPHLPTTHLDSVYFYGAGCTKEKSPIVAEALKKQFEITGACEVATDMLAAARGLCGHQPGIACIMGTGSNSCAYDGKDITKNVSPLGFILGDEGSGAVLGRTLVGDVLKNQLPKDIVEAFHAEFGLSNADIIDHVYRQKFPNRFLASFVPFLAKHIENKAIFDLVKENFRRFLVRNVKQYQGWEHLPIGFVGSIAYYFQQPLKEALEAEHMTIGKTIQAPMEGLIAYHTTKV